MLKFKNKKMNIKLKKEKIILCLEIIVLIIIDQIIKMLVYANKQVLPINLINNILNLNYVENFGIAFGMAKGGLIIFIALNLIIIGILFKFLFFSKEKLTKGKSFCLTIICAGGIGNLIDRIFRGYVIDYIDFSQMIDFPIFNFADIMIVIGTISIACIIIIEIVKESKNKN